MTSPLRRWTYAEDMEITLLMANGPAPDIAVKALASRLGRTYLAVRRRARKLGCSGTTRFYWMSLRRLEKESGYSRSRLLIAIERLGIRLQSRGKRADGSTSPYAVPRDRIEEIFAECQKAPDGGLLNASKHGEWGKRGKYRVNPAACLRCSRNDKPHYSKGYCRACYSQQYRERKGQDHAEREAQPLEARS